MRIMRNLFEEATFEDKNAGGDAEGDVFALAVFHEGKQFVVVVGIGGNAEGFLDFVEESADLPERIPIGLFLHLPENGLLVGFPGGIGVGDQKEKTAEDDQPDKEFEE